MTTVFDACVLVKLVLLEPGTEQTLRLFARAERVCAPGLALAECANTLWKAQRRGDIGVEGALERLDRLRRLDVDYAEWEGLLPAALRLAVELPHDTYDCVYLALAIAERASLATADRRLAEHAASLGLDVVAIEV